MPRYEVMAVLSGKLDEAAVKKTIGELQDSLGGVVDLSTVDHGLKQLAYEIKGNDKGHYVQFNFDGTGPQVAEFRRLAIINANVLRQLVVNIEKDYGHRATVNETKVKRMERKRVLKAEFDKRREEEIRNNPELAARLARQAERRYGRGYGRRQGPAGPGAGTYTGHGRREGGNE